MDAGLSFDLGSLTLGRGVSSWNGARIAASVVKSDRFDVTFFAHS